MRINLRGTFAAIAMCGTLFAFSAPANAVPLVPAPDQSVRSDVLEVHYRNYWHEHNSYRRPGFNIYIAPRPRHHRPRYGYNSHVQWCLNNFNSYNPNTNRYKTHSGYWKVCRSPYR